MENEYVYVAEYGEFEVFRVFRLLVNPLDEAHTEISLFIKSQRDHIDASIDHNNPIMILSLGNLLSELKRTPNSVLHQYYMNSPHLIKPFQENTFKSELSNSNIRKEKYAEE